MTKPLIAALLLVVMLVAVKTGIITLLAQTLVSPLARPHGPTNAGEIYQQEIAKRDHREAGPAR